MSKSHGMPGANEPKQPILPCPTSPMQQTDSESWEHAREPREYDQHRNQHIDDRAVPKSGK